MAFHSGIHGFSLPHFYNIDAWAIVFDDGLRIAAAFSHLIGAPLGHAHAMAIAFSGKGNRIPLYLDVVDQSALKFIGPNLDPE